MARKLCLVLCLTLLLGSLVVVAEDGVTGPVMSLTEDAIVIETGSGSSATFVITDETSVEEGVEKGARVMVQYHKDDAGKLVADRVTVPAQTQPSRG
ncbi:MAG: hypothetical protein PVF68_02490 [Acidobacteriota bacterium]